MKNKRTFAGILWIIAIAIVSLTACASMTITEVEWDTLQGPQKARQFLGISNSEVKVFAHFKNGDRRQTSAGTLRYDKNIIGPQTVIVSVNGVAGGSFETEVMKLIDIRVERLPTKTAYTEGEQAALSGIRVMGKWEGMPDAEIPVSQLRVADFNSSAEGSTDITVSYNGMNASFPVTVTARAVAPASAPASGTGTNSGNSGTPASASAPDVDTPASVSAPGTTNEISGSPASPNYGTGTPGLEYTLIDSGKAYCVDQGTVTSGVVTIPAFYRPNASSEYLPVTEVAGGIAPGSGAFNRTDITGVTFLQPSNITKIGGHAFLSTDITSITIPNSVTTIDQDAFSACTKLTSVTLGSGVKTIHERAFTACYAVTSFTVNAANPNFASQNGILYNKAMTELVRVPVPVATGAFTIPSGVTAIGNSAFGSCYNLTSVSMGSGVKTIGDNAFAGCTDLTSITIGSGVTSIGAAAFEGCRTLTNIVISDSVTSIGGSAFYDTGIWRNTPDNSFIIIGGKWLVAAKGWRTISGSRAIPAGVTLIADSAFSSCSLLTSVTLPNTVKHIGSAAFLGCSALTSMTIPNSVTSIGGFAFEHCNALPSVTIGSGVIGNNAFSGCTALTSVTIGSGVETVGNDAFSGCTALTSITVDAANPNYASQSGVLYNKARTQLIKAPIAGLSGAFTIPAGVTSINERAFGSCTKLTSITIGSGVKTIGELAFYGCTGLTSVTIPNSVTSIGASAFSSCTALTSVTIGSGVETVGERAFYDCTKLTSITIGSGVKTIGDSAFFGCTALKSVTIPDSVTSIGRSAFQSCTALASVTIGSGVKTIDNQAFFRCTSLTSVTVRAATPPTFNNSNVFNENHASRRFYVPAESVNTYKKASRWSAHAAVIQAIP